MRKTEHEHDFRHFSFRYSRLDFRVRWRFLEEIATSMQRFRRTAEGEMRSSGTGVNVPLQCVLTWPFPAEGPLGGRAFRAYRLELRSSFFGGTLGRLVGIER